MHILHSVFTLQGLIIWVNSISVVLPLEPWAPMAPGGLDPGLEGLAVYTWREEKETEKRKAVSVFRCLQGSSQVA